MTSSNYSESHEPESEFESPFLDETFFTDEAAARASQAWESRHSIFNKVESPFLNELELWKGAAVEPEDGGKFYEDSKGGFYPESEEEFYKEFEEAVELEIEPEIESELSEDDKKKMKILFEASKKIFSDSTLSFERDINWIRGVIALINEDLDEIIKHLRFTRNLFECPKGKTVRIDEIDWPLVLIIAGREASDKMVLKRTSRPDELVITAGKDTHPQGVAGFDYLYQDKYLNLFPIEVRNTLKPVEKGIKKGREDRKPALIPVKFLLAGAVVNIVFSERIFVEAVRAAFKENSDKLLSGLSLSAKRYWIALSFSRSGWMRGFVLRYSKEFDKNKIIDLNYILEDEKIRRKKVKAGREIINPVRIAYRAAIQAWILERYELPTAIKDFFSETDREVPLCKLPADYSCVRPRLHNYEFVESEIGSCVSLTISNTPMPCRFYTIKYKIDAKGLIDLAGRAYGASSSKLKLAQWINNHSYNQRFWRKNNVSKSFPKGRISFNPRFSGDISQQANAVGLAPLGNAFATIFIPSPPDWLGKTFSSCAQAEIEAEATQRDTESEFWAIEEELEPELVLERPYVLDYALNNEGLEKEEEELEKALDENLLEKVETKGFESLSNLEALEEENIEPDLEFNFSSESEHLDEEERNFEDFDALSFQPNLNQIDSGDLEYQSQVEEFDEDFLEEMSSPELESPFLKNFEAIEVSGSESSELEEEHVEAFAENWAGIVPVNEADIDLDIPDHLEVSYISQPTPGYFYTIQYSKGGLLKTAQRAYGTTTNAERLKRAQQINNHPLNRKFWRKPSNAYEREFFPQGIISFSPVFTCGEAQSLAGKGEKKSFAKIWIPIAEQYVHPKLGKAIDFPKNVLLALLKPATNMSAAELELLQYESSGVMAQEKGRLTKVLNPKVAPYRFICSIIFTAKHPTKQDMALAFGPATGTLIGFRHVLTAAHVLSWEWQAGAPAKAEMVYVIPMQHSSSGLPVEYPEINDLLMGYKPLGSFLAKSYKVHPHYVASGPSVFDIALIKLKDSIGNLPWAGQRFGYWGSTQFGDGTMLSATSDRSLLANKNVCLSGYPDTRIARHGINQWEGCGPVDNIDLPSYAKAIKDKWMRLGYQIETDSGHSGSPVWVIFKSNGKVFRRLVAVHSDGGFDIEASSGVLITPEVLDWIIKSRRRF